MNKKLIEKAKKDFNEIIKKSSEKDKKAFIRGYGVKSLFFAKRYISPQPDNKTYKAIYNIAYNWAENYQKKLLNKKHYYSLTKKGKKNKI